jgi:GT2 family glycosyltransferase
VPRVCARQRRALRHLGWPVRARAAPAEEAGGLSGRHRVTAVIVASDGAVWLPAVLTVLGGQTRHPDAVVGVDAGSSDASARILTESLGYDRVVVLDRSDSAGGFGASVNAGLASGVLKSDSDEAFDGETTEWVWLLHDDSAPADTCLEHLLAAADAHPRAAILGPKALGWHDRRLLLEMGFSVTGAGRRVTGLERREHDQGQHDERSEVHAVGTAGMLVRRDVWDALGGFDPQLPLYRDDLDLCWRAWRAGYEVRVVPEAVVHHREASYHGRREGSSLPGRGHRLDRRSALLVLLAQAPGWRLPFTAIRLTLGSLLRSLLYLLGKDLRRAGDEIAAIGSLLTHPGRIMASRRRVAATSTLSSREAVHDLRPGAWSQARAAIEALGGIVAAGRAGGASSVGALESGPVSDDADIFEDPADGFVRRALSRPAVVIALVLLVAAAIAGRSLWWGDGVLFGGALLPSPEGAGDLWAAYTDTWHDVGPGSTVPAAPLTALLAALATLVLGKGGLMVGLLLLLAVPAAGLSAWWSLRAVIVARGPRTWAAVAYALLPAMTGAIASGRLGAMVAIVLLPPLVRVVVRLLGMAPGLAPVTGRTPWGASLLAALVVACAPVTWVGLLLAVIGALVAAGLAGRLGRDLLLRSAALLVVPLVLLVPWSLRLLAHPSLLFSDLGVLTDVDVPGAPSLLLVDPGGPGTPPAWVMAGLVIAALLAVLRPATRPAVLTAWGVALVAFALALVSTRVPLTPPGSEEAVVAWAGLATAIMGAALILAAALAADGLRASMAESAFTWRQPVAGVTTILALLTPLIALLWWLPGAGDPVRRGDPVVLPPFVIAEAIGPEAPRTLLLRPQDAARVDYILVNGTGPTLGDGEVAPPAEDWAELDRLVAGLVSGRGGDEVSGLAAYAVRYVVLEQADAQGVELASSLDSVPGLRRVAGQEGEVLWRVEAEASRVVLVDGATPPAETPLPLVRLSSAEPFVDTTLTQTGVAVRLAQTADPAWRASLDGATLAASTIAGEAEGALLQEFTLPADAQGSLVITIDDGPRTLWLWAQAIAWLVIAVLALPARRSAGDDDADGDIDPDAGPDDEHDDVTGDEEVPPDPRAEVTS